MSLIKQMRQETSFSEGEQQIAEYLLKNPWEDLTIKQLAERTYTSNATIIRMCRRLGYEGFRPFKVDFIKEMEADKYLVESVNYAQPFHGKAGTYDIIRNIGTLYKESVDLILKSVKERDILEAGRLILNARRVYIYAIGDSMITARAFANRLTKLDIYPIMAYEFNEDGAVSYSISKHSYRE